MAINKIIFTGKILLDNIHAQNTVLTDTEILAIVPSTPQIWGINTNFLSNFENTLESGNYVTAETVTGWRLKRKRQNDSLFTTLKDFSKTTLAYVDKTVRNNNTYLYTLHSLSASGESLGIEGNAITDFWGWFLIDPTTNTSYKFDLMNSTDNIQVNDDVYTYKNYTKYPVISYGKSEYKTSKFTTMPYTYSDITKQYTIDLDLLNTIQAFINNKSPKILKNALGELFYVSTYGFEYKINDVIPSQIYTISFNWAEIGDADVLGL